MNFLAACEELAANIVASGPVETSSHSSNSDQSRWQKLFGFSIDEAAKSIQDWRADFTRPTMSQESWLTVKDAKVAEGFDKESYEYSIFRAKLAFRAKSGATVKDEDAQYLLKMEHEVDRCSKSADLLRYLPKKPKVFSGKDDDGNKTLFCLLTCSEKAEFLSALPPGRPPMLIRVSIAQKNLSATSLYPTLGIDTTLPQFRPNNSADYPVWYFFYGTLTDANILSRVIGLDKDAIEYKQACVCRGRLSTWGEKYLGLVDADEGSKVYGWAYKVKSQSEEDSLRVYETGKYEVVRCTMEFMDGDGAVIQGLTFRLV
ncbi:gamma-glutamyl cyclotransferase, AIG2-like domain-containing protein [Trichoderma breve]|uniref:Putative gamma-glutamylcyclotransferase n=1 Tax=Trichoderma breve TaxID=2034170 RepID=A0A9W9B6Q5_9HYPO|nr:gamma-glutamyl cyclotransferase, AIG2-like domain-containing protein [Trichoderma breve]KAJ4856964.1 gamma-glutamyl cyclotransferase, AIG2-like domain-containing protein [Trichoderma breve]